MSKRQKVSSEAVLSVAADFDIYEESARSPEALKSASTIMTVEDDKVAR